MRSSAAACRRRTSNPVPSDGDRRPAISVTSPHLPGSGRLPVTTESTFNVLAFAAEYYSEKSTILVYIQEYGDNYMCLSEMKFITIDNVSIKYAYNTELLDASNYILYAFSLYNIYIIKFLIILYKLYLYNIYFIIYICINIII